MRRLWDTYRFPGFRPVTTVVGVFGDRMASVIKLVRGSKKRHVEPAVEFTATSTTANGGGFAIFLAATNGSIWRSRSGASIASVAAK